MVERERPSERSGGRSSLLLLILLTFKSRVKVGGVVGFFFKSPEEKLDAYIAKSYEVSFWNLQQLASGDLKDPEILFKLKEKSRVLVRNACLRFTKDTRIVVSPEVWYDYYWLMTARRLGFDPNLPVKNPYPHINIMNIPDSKGT